MELSANQKKALKEAWFIYGNKGRKSTLLNHKLIQGFLHYNEDRRTIYIKGNKNMKNSLDPEQYSRSKVTDECLKVVNLILDNNIDKALKIAKS